MLVLFNLPRGLLSLTSMPPSSEYCNKRKVYRVMTHFCITTVTLRSNAISALRLLMTDFPQTLKVGFDSVKVQNFFGKCFAFLCFTSVLDGLPDCVTRYGKNFSEFRKRKFACRTVTGLLKEILIQNGIFHGA